MFPGDSLNDFFPTYQFDPTLPVVKEWPADAECFASGEGTVAITKTGEEYYHCQHCGGWIKGRAIAHREDTSGPLCGRQGTAYICIRCGREINFFGVYH